MSSANMFILAGQYVKINCLFKPHPSLTVIYSNSSVLSVGPQSKLSGSSSNAACADGSQLSSIEGILISSEAEPLARGIV